MPVVVNEKRQKLSKRRDKVALETYRDEGYLADGDAQLPDAARLGALRRPRDRAVGSVIEDEFRLEDVNPSPAFFDEKKLRAFNGEYIRALPLDEFVDGVRAVGQRRIAGLPARPSFAAIAPQAQQRLALLSDVVHRSTSCSSTSRRRSTRTRGRRR